MAASSTGMACAGVFVSSEKDNAIMVFDNDGAFVRSIPTCKRPRHMAWVSGGTRIMVACGGSDQLGVVDLATGAQVDSITTGQSPAVFGLSPDGKTAYVSIEEGSQMVAYDIDTKQPVFSVKTGAQPEGVLATPDGKLAFVASQATNTVHVVDLPSRQQVGTIRVGKRPRRMALVPGGAELWVTNELGSSVSVIDTASRTVTHTLDFDMPGMRKSDTSPVGVLFTPDGKTAWVALGRANHVAQVDVPTHTVRRVALTGKHPWGMGLGVDGSRLYVVNSLSDDLTLVDTRRGKATRTVPAGRLPHSVLSN